MIKLIGKIADIIIGFFALLLYIPVYVVLGVLGLAAALILCVLYIPILIFVGLFGGDDEKQER